MTLTVYSVALDLEFIKFDCYKILVVPLCVYLLLVSFQFGIRRELVNVDS